MPPPPPNPGIDPAAVSAGPWPAGWEVPPFTLQGALPRRHDWAVVIPVVNEGSRIAQLLQRMSDCGTSARADILLSDGGSTDGSLSADLLQRHQVHGLLSKAGPPGLSGQLRCAYAFCLQQGYRGIVTIDGNNKDDPSSIARFIVELERGFDFVQASRYLPGGGAINVPRSRDLAIRLVHAPLLRRASGFAWTDTTQGFRGYSRKLLLHPGIAPFRRVFAGYELLAYLSYRAPRLGLRCLEVPTVRTYPRGKIPSKISALRGNFYVLRTLLRACRGAFDPPGAP